MAGTVRLWMHRGGCALAVRGCTWRSLSGGHSRLAAITASGFTARAAGSASSTRQYDGTNQRGAGGDQSDARLTAQRISLASAGLCAMIGGGYIYYRKTKLQAAEPKEEDSLQVSLPTADGEAEGAKPKRPKRKKPTFREQQIINYEDRIRAYSTPDKIFRMFATLKVREENGDAHVLMTPEDFVRSITPGVMQPEGLGFDEFRNFERKAFNTWMKQEKQNDPDSLFAKLGAITFTDYIFLLTVISTPKQSFALAFKMFDIDGDGNVDYAEFQRAYKIILRGTAVGARHRNHANTGNVLGDVSKELAIYLFGEDFSHKLTVEKFQNFHDELTLAISKLEFERFVPFEGTITDKDFCELLLSYADLSVQQKKVYLKRVRRVFDPQESPGITFDQLMNFNIFLSAIFDVDIALGMYHAAGASINKADFKRVAKAVTNITLDDHLVDLVFVIFDENNDGELGHKEFIDIMKRRITRGLEKPKELGVARIFNAVMTCTAAKFRSSKQQ